MKAIQSLRIRLIDLLSGLNIAATISNIKKEQYLPAAQLEQLRTERLKRLWQVAKRHTRYYQQYSQLEDVPVLSKALVKANGDNLRASNYKGKLFLKATSGSTGSPFKFYTSAASQSYLWAGLMIAWEIAGYRPGQKVGFVAGSAVAKKSLKHRIFYKLLNIVTFPVATISDDTIEHHLKAIEREGITVLYGYALAFHAMATYMLDKGIAPPKGLTGIVTTSEELSDKSRQIISQAFGVKVYNQYGCQEAGVAAFECEQQHLHLISSRCVTEITAEGNLLGTDLANDAFIMMRFDTGDMVEFGNEPCTCGRSYPVIKSIKGRSADMVVDQNHKKIHTSFFNFLFKDDPAINQYQVLFDDHAISVNLKLSGPIDDQHKNYYLGQLKAHLSFEQYDLKMNEHFLTKGNSKHSFIVDKRSTANGTGQQQG